MDFYTRTLVWCFVLCFSVFKSNASTTTNEINQEYFVLPSAISQQLTDKNISSISPERWIGYQSSAIQLAEGKNWLAVRLHNNSAQSLERVLVIDGRQFVFNEAIYRLTGNNQLNSHPSEHRINNLIYSHLTLSSNETVTYYIQVHSRAENKVNLTLLEESAFEARLTTDYFTSGIAIGGIGAIAIVLVFVFFATANKTILLLTGYFCLLAINLAVMHGINLYSFYPEYQNVQGVEFPIFTSLSALAILWFSSELFTLKTTNKKLYLVYYAFGLSMLVNVALSYFLSFDTNVMLCNVIYHIVTILLLPLVIHLWRIKHSLAHLFTVFVLLQASASVLNVLFYGIFELNAELFTIGYWLTGLLIIFIMARQASLEINAKQVAQKAALKNALMSRQAQDELLSLQEETQEQLEQRVQERTLELNIALQELEEANRELEQKNTIDELTGLFNRRYYDQKLLAEFRRSRRNLTPLSLVVIDIDHFKTINDQFGHTGGDTCLIKLAKLIKQCLRRSSDIGCRYGGEEFCLILPETDTDGAISIAEELRRQVVTTSFSIEQHSISLTISCGVSTYKQQSDVNPIDIFNAADKALYQAKENGRNQVKEFAITAT